MPDILIKPMQILATLALAFIIIVLWRRARRRMQAHDMIPSTFSLVTGSLVNWTVIAFAAAMILETLGMPIRSVWTGILSIVVMVAVAFFASWSVLSNIFSSLLLLTFSKLRMGDIVELRDTKRDEFGITGRVVDLNAFFVTLQEVPGFNQPKADADEAPTDRPDKKPAQIQIPNHLFFFRVMRRWPGTTTQPLIDAYQQGNRQDPQKLPDA